MRTRWGRLLCTCLLGLGAVWAGQTPRDATSPMRPAPATASRPASTPATNPAAFKVASFNVLYQNLDLKAVAETIRKAGADVVCLQETNDASEKYLREQLRKTYPYGTFHAGGGGASGLGILSRTPLRNVKHLPAKEGWFGTHLCEANLAGRAVQIVSVHLTASTPPPNASAAEVLKLLPQREAVRAKEIAYILANTDPNKPRIIAGDFNAQPPGSAPRFLKDKGFVDSLASARADHEKVTTWSGKIAGMQMAFRVDFIFHTKDLQSTDCQVLPCAASDHSLVVSTLRWAQAATASSPTAPDANRPATTPASRN